MGVTSDFEGCITHGPWGGSQGNKWVYMPQPQGGFTKKVKITVRYGLVIDSIEFQICCRHCKQGETSQTSRFGGPGGDHTDTIFIDNPNEYIMSISGTFGGFDGSDVVKSLCFMTNLNLYGPFGTNDGTAFSYDVKDCLVLGFHGRVNRYLNSIGVYVMPASQSLAYGGKANNEEELCSSLSRIALKPRDAGPWGAGGGKPWDDGIFSTIKQVRVHLGGELNVIYAIQFQYLKSDGKCALSQIHGGSDGFKIEHVVINLDVEAGEFLTGISGSYGPVEGYNGLEAIVSITFHTNKGTHGPYGEENGVGYVYYSSTASPGKVVGLHGRSNGFLNAIGVHMEYF